ncbi:N-acetylmuramidase domain-containing protein [Mesorhizobium marinum]|uniref:N-acetylmuramidase domain-containing protein n=1 Tax=Mesorhizobium marinum TaxID=3228790 RepID=A0ABV3QUB7_9HYPH
MFSKATADEIAEVAAEFGIEAAALLAVAEVESGGSAFASIGGRQEPMIRFEGHYFDRCLSGDARAVARAAGLASPVAGAVANPASQAARWRMLERAAAIDRKAAYESTSWGLGQVMGAHWAWLGFENVDRLVAEARAGTAGQTRLMARFIVKAGLADALKRHDWSAFARGYNGPGYRRNAYHAKLAAAHRRHLSDTRKGMVEPAAPAQLTLHIGARGAAVRDLQRQLAALGYPVAPDGIFGPDTETALRAFQRDHGLIADGMAGPRTCRAIMAALPLEAWWRRTWRMLSGWFGRM